MCVADNKYAEKGTVLFPMTFDVHEECPGMGEQSPEIYHIDWYVHKWDMRPMD